MYSRLISWWRYQSTMGAWSLGNVGGVGWTLVGQTQTVRLLPILFVVDKLGGCQHLAALPWLDVMNPTIRHGLRCHLYWGKIYLFFVFFLLGFAPFSIFLRRCCLGDVHWFFVMLGGMPCVVVIAYCYAYFPAIASCTSWCSLLWKRNEQACLLARQARAPCLSLTTKSGKHIFFNRIPQMIKYFVMKE